MQMQFGSVIYSCGVTVNYYCGSDLVLTSDTVFIHKTVLMRSDSYIPQQINNVFRLNFLVFWVYVL